MLFSDSVAFIFYDSYTLSKTISEERLYRAYQYAIDAAFQLGMNHTFLRDNFQVDRTISWRIRNGIPSASLPEYLNKLVRALNDCQNCLERLAEHKSGDFLQADLEKIRKIDRFLADITRIRSGEPPKYAKC